MSQKDFVPDSFKNLRDWAQNYLDQIDAIATRIGWPAADITALKARLTKIHAATQAVLDKQTELDSLTGLLADIKDTELPEIRLDTAKLKKTRGFNDGDAKTLSVQTTSASFDASAYQPGLNVEEKKGRNELMAKKLGADSLNIYVRHKGETPFRLLAAKRVRFPLDDDTASADGKAEEREYQAIGVQGDDEIGQPSDIVSAVWRP